VGTRTSKAPGGTPSVAAIDDHGGEPGVEQQVLHLPRALFPGHPDRRIEKRERVRYPQAWFQHKQVAVVFQGYNRDEGTLYANNREVLWFVAGASIGAGVALLYAPKIGQGRAEAHLQDGE